MFVLLPIFAVLLALVFRRRGCVEHLAFAFHMHAFLFLALMSGRRWLASLI